MELTGMDRIDRMKAKVKRQKAKEGDRFWVPGAGGW
jgi:hypothetical protein